MASLLVFREVTQRFPEKKDRCVTSRKMAAEETKSWPVCHH